MKERIALFPGTFDPFTLGHLSIVSRGAQLFDRLIVAVGVNSAKDPGKAIEARLDSIRTAVSKFDNVTVKSYDGLTVDACKNEGASFILRGVRSVADYEYERTLADVNRDIAGIETVILYSLPQYASVSSSIVRELERFGVDVSKFVP